MPIIRGARVPAPLLERIAALAERAAAADEAARDIVERARQDAERLCREGAARGREEALAVATRDVAWAELRRQRALASAGEEVVDLAFEVARRVVGGAVERGGVVEVAARALEAVRRRANVVLHAAPADVAVLRDAEPALGAMLACGGFALREDASLPRGSVAVESEGGRLEARLDVQLRALREAFDRAAAERAGGAP